MHGGEASSQVLQDSRAPLSSQGPQGFQSSPAGAEFAELNPGFPLLAIPGTAALRLNLELCRPRSKVWAGLSRAAAPSPCPATAPPPPRHRQGLLEPLRQSWASPRAPAWGYLGQYSSSPPTSAPPAWIGSRTRFVPGHIRDVPLRLPR